jgi:hypothetical protein
MNIDLSRFSRRDLFKAIGTEHLNATELRLFREQKLDKDTMSWAVVHISECPLCCSLVPVLTAEKISDALAGTPSGRPDYVEQVLEYYFETLEEAKR